MLKLLHLLSLENLIPKISLKQWYGEEQLGIYSSIASPTLVVQVFASVAFNPFLPAFSLAYQQGEWKKFRGMFHKALAALAGMCLVVTLGGMLFGRLGLTILFGESILEHYNLFLPIVWCTILTALIWILSSLVVAVRRIKWLLAGMACCALGWWGHWSIHMGKMGSALCKLWHMPFILCIWLCYVKSALERERETNEKVNHYTSLQ